MNPADIAEMSLKDIAEQAASRVASLRQQPSTYADNNAIIAIYELIGSLAQGITELAETLQAYAATPAPEATPHKKAKKR